MLTTISSKLQNSILSWRWWLNMDNLGDKPVPVKSLTIVITACNEGKTIGACIESVLRQTYNRIHPITIIAVNDASTDNTREIIDSFADRGVQAIHNPVATGRKAGASNLGLAQTKTELFLALDADGVLDDDAIEKAIRRFSDPNVKMVAGSVSARNTGTLWEKARYGEYLYAFGAVKKAQGNTFGVIIASGCFSLVKTEYLRELGGYSLRTLAEDLDLTMMFRERRWKVAYASDAVCTVVDPHTYEDFDKQVTRWSNSFIQNFQVRNWNLFWPNPWLGVFMYAYLIWSIVGPFFLPIVLMAFTKNIPLSIVSLIGMQAITVWVPMYIRAIYVKMPLKIVTASLWPMFAAQYVNVWIMYRTLFKIFVLKQSKNDWERGHA